MFEKERVHNLYSLLYTRLADKSTQGIINVMFEIDLECYSRSGSAVTYFSYEKDIQANSIYLYELADIDFIDQIYIKHKIDYDMFSIYERKIIDEISLKYESIECINGISKESIELVNRCEITHQSLNNDYFILIDFNEYMEELIPHKNRKTVKFIIDMHHAAKNALYKLDLHINAKTGIYEK